MSCQGIYVTIPLSSESALWFTTFKSTQHQAKGTPVRDTCAQLRTVIITLGAGEKKQRRTNQPALTLTS